VFNPRPHWQFDDPVASAATFRGLAEAASEPFERALWQTQLARALGLAGRLDQGHSVLDSIGANSPELDAWSAIERGRLHRSAGQPDLARPFFETSCELALQNHLDALRVDALHVLALVSPIDEQIALTKQAITESQASADPQARAWLGSLLNNLGVALGEKGEWQSALEVFEQGLEVQKANGDQERISIARFMVGKALRKLGKIDQARSHMQTLKHDIEAVGQTDEFINAELDLLNNAHK